jgi:hypothetical protein
MHGNSNIKKTEQQIVAKLHKLGIQHRCGSEEFWHVKIIPPY